MRREPGQLIRRLAIFPSRSSKLIGPVPLKPSPETVSVTVQLSGVLPGSPAGEPEGRMSVKRPLGMFWRSLSYPAVRRPSHS